MSHVSLHLWRVPAARVPAAVLRMGIDRLRLRGVEGLTFSKLLGTGDGRTFDVRDADVRTWGLLACWESQDDSLDFETHATPRGWRRIAVEEWRADLRCTRARGRWSGREPFTPEPRTGGYGGPVAAITRARLEPAKMLDFWRAVPAVVDDLAAGPGPLVKVGIGEAPIGLQGTFTLWRDAADLAAFAYARAPHRAAIAATEERGWYAEECFARFEVTAQRGTLFGLEQAA